MKAQTYKPERMTYPCWGQPKKDGLRAMFIDGHFYSGDGKQWNDRIIGHLLEPLRKLKIKVRLDGELYVYGWSLQDINSAIGVNRVSRTPETTKVQFHVFDVIDPDHPFQLRLRTLMDTFVRYDLPWEQYHDIATLEIHDQEQADEYYRVCIQRKYEGAIYRLQKAARIPATKPPACFIDHGYVAGARPHWMLKRKERYDGEYKIVAVHEGKMTDKGGKHVGRLGALECVTKGGKHFNVGTGYSDSERQELWDNPPIGKLLRVQFRCLSEDKVPLEPRSLGIRDYA